MCPVSVLTNKQALIFLASLEVQFLGSSIFGRPMFQKIWGYTTCLLDGIISCTFFRQFVWTKIYYRRAFVYFLVYLSCRSPSNWWFRMA
ncbi:hypothetical protein MANES_02G101501v8 [Manihot esculenta]|uniref:Uncharacterized protein n=1 Tax=Manihot esculenta TaxID=3983 RepID=A0ACB7I6H9_MANES|nr:hypothetical protein MANES_02G101501v8 [Manihot esculenta]